MSFAIDSKEPSPPRSLGEPGVEFYRHRTFVYLYDRWLPTEPDAWSATILWPA